MHIRPYQIFETRLWLVGIFLCLGDYLVQIEHAIRTGSYRRTETRIRLGPRTSFNLDGRGVGAVVLRGRALLQMR